VYELDRELRLQVDGSKLEFLRAAKSAGQSLYLADLDRGGEGYIFWLLICARYTVNLYKYTAQGTWVSGVSYATYLYLNAQTRSDPSFLPSNTTPWIITMIQAPALLS
jgi:hypothetical protein